MAGLDRVFRKVPYRKEINNGEIMERKWREIHITPTWGNFTIYPAILAM